MANCSVTTCKERPSTSNMQTNGVSYHTFPNEPLLREQWIKFCKNKPDWQPSEGEVICSDHFTDSCWVPLSNESSLVDGAIPTIYPQSAEDTGTGEDDNKIVLGTGGKPTAAQIKKLIDIHPQIRTIKGKIEMKAKRIKRLQSKIQYIKHKLNLTKQLLNQCKMEVLRYRQIPMKKRRPNNRQHQRNEMIPSVKRSLSIKRALFNMK